MNGLEEIATLRAALADREAELTGAHLLIAQYKAQLHKLRRMQFGRSSEALDEQIHQLELKLEDLEESEAARNAAKPCSKGDQPGRDPLGPERRQPVRRVLPDHLPREDVIHAPEEICPGCGGTHFSRLGEDKTEAGKIPARVKVIRHIPAKAFMPSLRDHHPGASTRSAD